MYRMLFFLESGRNHIVLDIRRDIWPEPEPDPYCVMYSIFSILDFCHKVVTTYKYKTYTHTPVIFIQFTQVSKNAII